MRPREIKLNAITIFRCSKVEMKNRSNFYLTTDDILDNEKVEMRQKNSASGDSELGQSGKF